VIIDFPGGSKIFCQDHQFLRHCLKTQLRKLDLSEESF
jgi:hypothetical protein